MNEPTKDKTEPMNPATVMDFYDKWREVQDQGIQAARGGYNSTTVQWSLLDDPVGFYWRAWYEGWKTQQSRRREHICGNIDIVEGW